MSNSQAPVVVCLMGPTAAGKTDAGIHLAQRLGTDIVSVDSALVYRGMDIGTAKPSHQQRQSVHHHLIDIIDPRESYSAARFCADARRHIDAALLQGKTPLLVGGTMLYFKALQQGLDDLPGANAPIRAQIEREALSKGWPALHAELATIDTFAAARLAPNDSQRIQRALEIWRATGVNLTDHFSAARTQQAVTQFRFVNLSMETDDRAELHRRIEKRLDAMLENGLVDEVRSLRARGDLGPDMPSMRCVGYRQVWQYLEGHIHGLEVRDKAIAATRQLAKRQMTWLRSFTDRVVIDVMGSQPLAALDAALDQALGR